MRKVDRPEHLGVNGVNGPQEQAMRNTKWTKQVDMDVPELPEWFWERTGVSPVKGVVDD